jgi:hypothetical protein
MDIVQKCDGIHFFSFFIVYAVAARSKAGSVFVRPNNGIMGSNPT